VSSPGILPRVNAVKKGLHAVGVQQRSAGSERGVCRRGRPRQGEVDSAMRCVSDKCVSGSKDARAVRPYRV
jgi:hypothetical protein